MNDDEAIQFRDVVLSLWTTVSDLKAGEQALMRMMAEMSPYVSPEVVQIFAKYWDYKEKASEEILLALEKQFPNLAAELDKSRPLLPPDDQ